MLDFGEHGKVSYIKAGYASVMTKSNTESDTIIELLLLALVPHFVSVRAPAP